VKRPFKKQIQKGGVRLKEKNLLYRLRGKARPRLRGPRSIEAWKRGSPPWNTTKKNCFIFIESRGLSLPGAGYFKRAAFPSERWEYKGGVNSGPTKGMST